MNGMILVITDPYPLPVQYSTGDRFEIEFDIMERAFIRDKNDPDDIYYIEDLIWQNITFEIIKS